MEVTGLTTGLRLKAGLQARQYKTEVRSSMQTSFKPTITPSISARQGVMRPARRPAGAVHSASWRQGSEFVGQRLSSMRHSARPLRNACVAKRHVAVTRSELDSEKLPEDVREGVLDAIGVSGGRVTVGDVASRSGLKVSAVEGALQSLALDTGATLKVSAEGDIVYEFAEKPRSALAAKSLSLRIRPTLKKAQEVAGLTGRVLFGVSLLVSVVLVYVLIFALSSSSDSDSDSDGPDLDFGDMYWIWRPSYYEERQEKKEGEMNFFESIFSFVFGDGDPNFRLEQERWETVGRLIRQNDGVLTAEQLAPFTDATQALVYDGEQYADESFVLPVLQRFGGVPEVAEAGALLYRFPDIQTSAGQEEEDGEPIYDGAYLEEEQWKLTRAGPWQIAGTAVLGALNLAGVAYLSAMFDNNGHEFAGVFIDQHSGFAVADLALPALQVYASSFFAVPLVRSLLNRLRNAAIGDRNVKRADAALLLAEPPSALRGKLESVGALQRVRVIKESDIAYSTDKDMTEQDRELEGREFDEKLRPGA